MIAWMPRLSAHGRYVVGYHPGAAESATGSAAVLIDLADQSRRVLDADGTQPIWDDNTILVRSQRGDAVLRRYGRDGTPIETIEAPGPVNAIWPGRTAYLGPTGGTPPRLWRMDTNEVVPDMVAGVVLWDDTWLGLRHRDGALVRLPSGELLDPAPHTDLESDPTGPGWVARRWMGSWWALVVSGRLWAELGRIEAVAIQDGYVCWTRPAGEASELCVAHVSDPTRGWIVTRGDLRYPHVALLDETAIEVVWCDGRGMLGHASIECSAAAAVDLRVGVADPPPAETWAPTAEVVDLWRLFTGAGASQYPRRNPDDPGVYWDCQVARLSTRVEHAWFCKTANGRVYEWRATWVDPHFEAWIGLLEDHDEDGRIYRFRDPRLMRRFARAGDTWERVTQIQEWDRAANQWGPWGGPGSDGRFRFRVRVAAVERSSYGRLRAVIEVDTYQDLEIFELYSHKGWSAWEEWTRGHAERGGSPVRELPGGIRVARTKRVEWPERYDGPRQWPRQPRSSWPEAITLLDERAKVTIVEPAEWPQRSSLVDEMATLRCVYAVTDGVEPARVRWVLTGSDGSVREADNPGTDHDHTFVVGAPGTYRVTLIALGADGRELDRTGRVREWIVS